MGLFKHSFNAKDLENFSQCQQIEDTLHNLSFIGVWSWKTKKFQKFWFFKKPTNKFLGSKHFNNYDINLVPSSFQRLRDNWILKMPMLNFHLLFLNADISETAEDRKLKWKYIKVLANIFHIIATGTIYDAFSIFKKFSK